MTTPTSPESQSIDEADARDMVRLLGNTAAIDGGHQEKKRHLMDGLCQLLVADAWLWALSCQIDPEGAQTYANYARGNFDEVRFSAYLKAVEHPDMREAAAPFFGAIAATGRPVTMLQQEMDPKGITLEGDLQRLWEAADIGPVILSGHPLDASSLSGIGVYRRVGGRPFTSREKQLVHLVLCEVPWLHMLGWPEDRGVTVPRLTPQQRIVLNLLLDGLPRKAIASHMKISENTVAGYAKDVFRHFDVHSQPALMHKFLGATSDEHVPGEPGRVACPQDSPKGAATDL